MAEHPERDRVVAALDAIAETATSPDGAIAATVNADGVLTGLTLTDDVTGRTGAELAEQVLATYATALHAAARRGAEVLIPAGVSGFVLDRLAWRARFEPERPTTPSADADAEPLGEAVRYRAAW